MAWANDEENNRRLREKCDYAAQQFAAGKCDAVKFNIMGNEREEVVTYMESRHPSVRYFCDIAIPVMPLCHDDVVY